MPDIDLEPGKPTLDRATPAIVLGGSLLLLSALAAIVYFEAPDNSGFIWVGAAFAMIGAFPAGYAFHWLLNPKPMKLGKPGDTWPAFISKIVMAVVMAGMLLWARSRH